MSIPAYNLQKEYTSQEAMVETSLKKAEGLFAVSTTFYILHFLRITGSDSLIIKDVNRKTEFIAIAIAIYGISYLYFTYSKRGIRIVNYYSEKRAPP
jgi:hypothetical protein